MQDNRSQNQAGASKASPEPAAPETQRPGAGLNPRAAILVGLGLAPLGLGFLLSLWERPHYRFFPLALAGAAWLAWSRGKEARRAGEPGSALVSGPLLGLAFLLLAAGTALWSRWLGGVAGFVGLVGLVWWGGGWALTRTLSPALLMVLICLPPPAGLDDSMLAFLLRTTITISSRLLDLFGVLHWLNGGVLEMPGHTLLVGLAGSGLNWVPAMLAAGLFFVLWRKLSIWRGLVMLAGAFAFAVLGLVVFIMVGARLVINHQTDISSGSVHQVAGVILFVGGASLVVSLDRLLVFLTSPIFARELEKTIGAPALSEKPRPVPAPLSPSSGLAIGAAFALLGMVELGRGWVHHEQVLAESAPPESPLRADATFALPEQIGEWTQIPSPASVIEEVQTSGAVAKVWHYQRGNSVASVALDYPLRGHADAAAGYTARGWKVLQMAFQGGGGTNAAAPAAGVAFRKNLVTRGTLWSSTVDEIGHWQAAPARTGWGERLKMTPRVQPSTCRVQVFLAGYKSPDPAERELVWQLFEGARAQLGRQISEQTQHTL